MSGDRVDVDGLVRRAAIALAVVAFAGSYSHVAGFAHAMGQAWPLALAIAAMPEVSVAVCILRLRSGCSRWQGVWAVIVLATSAAFTVRANLGVQIPTDANAVMVAVWPAWAAIGAAGLVEMRRHRPATPAASRPAKPATAPASRPARTVAAAAGALAEEAIAWMEPPASRPATPALVAVPEVFPSAIPDQVGWFRRQLAAHPERTDQEWSEQTGLSERTTQRRIEAAGGRRPAAQLAAAGGEA